jgi:tryptophan 7-halogenase
MRIGVIGGGTAGFMAAAHVSRYHPDATLTHIFDPRIPIIGVGEGTNPDFPPWLMGVTGLAYADLARECNATRKYGIQYENWGQRTPKFIHNFYPIGETAAFHLSAAKLVDVLARYVRGKRVTERVTSVSSTGATTRITLENGETIDADLVVDARGFPRDDEGEDILTIGLIPTNAAFVRRGPVSAFQSAMRNIARPHGWVFVVPLSIDTAYGYVYNHRVSSQEEVSADLDALLAAEKVTPNPGPPRALTFPSFVRRRVFDGSLLRIGNTASFIEPLEATAIGLISQGLKAIDLIVKNRTQTGTDQRQGLLYQMFIAMINNTLFVNVWERAIFVGWHYSMGSAFRSAFWEYAVENYARHMASFHEERTRARFEWFLEQGRSATPERYDTFSSEIFGGFPAASFAEIGRGIGYFPN